MVDRFVNFDVCNISFKENLIEINFNSQIELIDIFRVVYTFLGDKTYIIYKILLIREDNKLKRVNDLTKIFNQNLLAIWFFINKDKYMSNDDESTTKDSSIMFNNLSYNFKIEIHTFNTYVRLPNKILSKEEALKLIIEAQTKELS